MTFSVHICLIVSVLVGVASLNHLVPNRMIKTSDGGATKLCTGLLYTIFSLELQGPVTYIQSDHVTSNEGEEGGSHILVVRNLNRRNGREYLPSGRYYKSTVFAFQKHSDYYYKMMNIDFASPVTYLPSIYAPVNADGNRHDTLMFKDIDHPHWDYYQPGGEWEESTLFTFLKHGKSHYKLFHKEMNSVVSYNPAAFSPANRDGSTDDTLVVRPQDSEYASSYLPGGQWEGSTVFRLTPVSYRFIATVTKFDYDESEFNLDELSLDKSLVGFSEVILNYDNEGGTTQTYSPSGIAKRIVNTVDVMFSNGNARRFLENDDVTLKMSAIFGFIRRGAKIEGDWDKKSFPLSQSKVFESDVTNIQPPRTKVDLPPHSGIEVTAFWNVINVTIPVEVTVEVRAVADRMMTDGSVREMVDVEVDAVRCLLDSRRFRVDFATNGDRVVLKLMANVRVQRAVKEFAQVDTTDVDE